MLASCPLIVATKILASTTREPSLPTLPIFLFHCPVSSYYSPWISPHLWQILTFVWLFNYHNLFLSFYSMCNCWNTLTTSLMGRCTMHHIGRTVNYKGWSMLQTCCGCHVVHCSTQTAHYYTILESFLKIKSKIKVLLHKNDVAVHIFC